MVPLANSARPLSDEQRKAIFAKSRGGGYRSKRDSDQRIAELRRQRDEIESLRTPPPEAKDFEQVNLRKLKETMLRAGQELNDITATLARAAETNRAKRQDINALKRQIREQYKDPAARKRALERQMAGFEKDHARAMKDWEAYNDQINAQVRRIDAKIREEEIVDDENDRAAETREARAQREEEERARKAEIAAEKEQRRLLERAAQEQARQERAEARKAVEQDPARLYRSELVKRRTYWEALKRGDTDQARRMYPQADHDRNLKDLETIRPKSGSKMQEAVFDGAFAKLKYEAP
jgi:DNA repair exonuclease SbcCD ATPase subunit